MATVCVVKAYWPIISRVARAETENEWTKWSSGYITHLDCERCGFESQLLPVFLSKNSDGKEMNKFFSLSVNVHFMIVTLCLVSCRTMV